MMFSVVQRRNAILSFVVAGALQLSAAYEQDDSWQQSLVAARLAIDPATEPTVPVQRVGASAGPWLSLKGLPREHGAVSSSSSSSSSSRAAAVSKLPPRREDFSKGLFASRPVHNAHHGTQAAAELPAQKQHGGEGRTVAGAVRAQLEALTGDGAKFAKPAPVVYYESAEAKNETLQTEPWMQAKNETLQTEPWMQAKNETLQTEPWMQAENETLQTESWMPEATSATGEPLIQGKAGNATEPWIQGKAENVTEPWMQEKAENVTEPWMQEKGENTTEPWMQEKIEKEREQLHTAWETIFNDQQQAGSPEVPTRASKAAGAGKAKPQAAWKAKVVHGKQKGTGKIWAKAKPTPAGEAKASDGKSKAKSNKSKSVAKAKASDGKSKAKCNKSKSVAKASPAKQGSKGSKGKLLLEKGLQELPEAGESGQEIKGDVFQVHALGQTPSLIVRAHALQDAEAAKPWKSMSSKWKKSHHHSLTKASKLRRQKGEQTPNSPTSGLVHGAGGDLAPAVLTAEEGQGLPEMAAALAAPDQKIVGDFTAFLVAFVINTGLVIGMILAFSVLRLWVPMVYSHNVLQQKVPFIPKESRFGWVAASLGCDIDDVTKHVGLDQAMLLQFSKLAMQILLTIGLPMMLLTSPCHAFFGGNLPETGRLSKLGMANVDGYSWLCWMHAVGVWLVVLQVQKSIYNAQGQFLKRRVAWLKMMPLPRASTVLVEGIPENMRSEEKVSDFFEKFMGPKSVTMVKFVKQTSHLRSLIEQKEVTEQKLNHAREEHATTGQRPTHLNRRLEAVDSLSLYEGQRLELSRDVDAERKRVKSSPSTNTGNAFVTFRQRREAEIALKCSYTPHNFEYVVSTPPDPSDVIYTDFQRDEQETRLRVLCGHALIAGVFVGFLPFVWSIDAFSSAENMTRNVPVLAPLLGRPAFAVSWDAMVGSLVLTFLVDFVPTFFAQIFSNFFVLRGEAFLQHRVQAWYFYFMVIFVLLVTAVGDSLGSSVADVVENPSILPSLLAARLPQATRFYLSYVPLQWVTHAQSLLRLVQLSKFNAFKLIFDEATAKQKAEPEDQDHYGIGARSARFSFILVTCLVFCSFSPLICILGFLNFALCRVVYGYLLVFAETRKPDLGGVFWVTMLKQVQQCMFIYITLMVGVLFHRADSWGPSIIVALSYVFMAISYMRFDDSFPWESLTMEDVTSDLELSKRSTSQKYEQPELAEEEFSGHKDASSQLGGVLSSRLSRFWSTGPNGGKELVMPFGGDSASAADGAPAASAPAT